MNQLPNNLRYAVIQGYNNYVIYENGEVYNSHTKKRLAQSLNNKDKEKGYYIVKLYNEDGKKNFKIHRLLAQYFIPNNDIKKICVDHIDRNSHNNDLSNLRWVTVKENNSNTCRTRFDIDETDPIKRVKILSKMYRNKPYTCQLCNKNIKNGSKYSHNQSKLHQTKIAIEKNKIKFNEVIKSLNDIFILNEKFKKVIV